MNNVDKPFYDIFIVGYPFYYDFGFELPYPIELINTRITNNRGILIEYLDTINIPDLIEIGPNEAEYELVIDFPFSINVSIGGSDAVSMTSITIFLKEGINEISLSFPDVYGEVISFESSVEVKQESPTSQRLNHRWSNEEAPF